MCLMAEFAAKHINQGRPRGVTASMWDPPLPNEFPIPKALLGNTNEFVFLFPWDTSRKCAKFSTSLTTLYCVRSILNTSFVFFFVPSLTLRLSFVSGLHIIFDSKISTLLRSRQHHEVLSLCCSISYRLDLHLYRRSSRQEKAAQVPGLAQNVQEPTRHVHCRGALFGLWFACK